MTAYYNEFDPFAAQWLRNLIDAGHIAPGIVDDRSITDVTASDLAGFSQCHFFAGIGGWSLALRLAGVPDNFRCWTGSPPCQPFSVAGKQLGQLDERHLAPTFIRLIAECRPAVLFGEQVAAAIGKHWLDDLFTELESESYACGAAVLPACSVGAPHKRDRIFFGAALPGGVDNAFTLGRKAWGHRDHSGHDGQQSGAVGSDVRMGYACCAGSQVGCSQPGGEFDSQRREGTKRPGRLSSLSGELAYPIDCTEQREISRATVRELSPVIGTMSARFGSAHQDYSFWEGADWLRCRDGRFRPVESRSFPLANGVPSRVGRLRGYGNAIVPQAAEKFITAFLGAASDTLNV